ncbi:MAG: DNA polymerase II large subunit, partial [Candidatus Heimdallarchaeota archaeon]|nr:DNA polymerase II large subunit [Candidatus Heimdallarchaeota archaeon]
MNQITQNQNLSINMQDYFDRLNDQLHVIYNIAEKARKKGLDPSLNVETPIAKDIADRVEGLIGPEGVGVRIRELEKENLSREQVAFRIAGEICDQKLIKGSKEILAEQALRTSLAVITESITAAPIEGIAKVKIKQNDDGTDYLAVYYSGPIRSAGGTAAGMSVLLGDFIRKRLKIGQYQPDQREVERYIEELELYNRVSHLQLPTTKEEQRFAAQNLPIEISGEPTDKVEVTGNRDLRRIETNRLRGGACLVFNDGLVGRSKKLIKKIKENKLDGWDWLNKLIEIHEKSSSISDEEPDIKYDDNEEIETEDEEEVVSDMGYIKDVIGGRPVFAHPSEKGGFRLRYGRSRTTGLAGMGVHPALMGLVDDFLACGTHVRTERPGKGAIVMPVDSIHPPIVKLKNGDVVKVESYEEAKAVRENLLEILFLGDMLYGVGEFNQNNFDLIPSGYCEEWWVQELEETFVDFKETTGVKIDNKLLEKIDGFIQHPYNLIPSPQEALELSDKLKIPLHPEFTYHWSDILAEEFQLLRNHIKSNSSSDNNILEIDYKLEVKEILESICIPHKLV